MKKCLAVCLCLVAAVSSLAGCGDGGGAAQGPAVPQTNEQLTVHVAPLMNSWLSTAISTYRKQYPDVELIVDDHDQDEWGSDIESMRAELMAGRGPDVIYDPTYYFPDINKTMGTGVFADMNYFLQSDPDLKKEELEEQILAAGQRNGKQYVMPLTYNIPLLLSSKETLAEAGIDEAACRENFLGIAREASKYLKSGKEATFYNAIYFGGYFPDFMGLPFLDYEKRTADFSFPEFREAVELYKDLYEQDNPEVDTIYTSTFDGYEAIVGRTAVFAPYYYDTGKDFFLNASVLISKETPVLIPIRATDGKSTALIERSAAINANSPNQQNAWNFVKILLSVEQQNEYINMMSLPVRKECLEARFESVKEDTTAESRVIEINDAGTTVELKPLPDSCYEEFQAAKDNIGHTTFIFGFVCGKTKEYLIPYYTGEKSLDACISELQNAMDIYMSE